MDSQVGPPASDALERRLFVNTRSRRLWLEADLIVDDEHLLPNRCRDTSERAAVSRYRRRERGRAMKSLRLTPDVHPPVDRDP